MLYIVIAWGGFLLGFVACALFTANGRGDDDDQNS